MTCNISEVQEQNIKEAIIHLLEIKKIRNPEKIVFLEPHVYAHTNMRGKRKIYKGYATFKKYKESEDYLCKMYSVNGYKIVENPISCEGNYGV